MKNKYFILLFILIFSFSYSWGYFTKRNEIFPYKIIKEIFGTKTLSTLKEEKAAKEEWYKKMYDERFQKIMIVYNYQAGDYIFTDKWYTNNLNEEKIIGKTLIQISRHRQNNVELLINKGTFIYRAVCEKNDNSHYKDWDNEEFKLEIIGLSCVHAKVFKKYFPKGHVVLSPGGPKASDPIFLDLSNIGDIKVKKEY